jgi:VanZ family protein
LNDSPDIAYETVPGHPEASEARPKGGFIRVLPVIAWLGVIFYQSSRSTLPFPRGFSIDLVSIAGHFAEYAILAALLWWAVHRIGRHERKRIAVVLGIALLYAISDEWHQSFVPGRYPDAFDVAVDVIGAACGLLAARWVLTKWHPTDSQEDYS